MDDNVWPVRMVTNPLPCYPAQPRQRHRPILATPTDEFDSGVIDRVKNINERRTGAL